MMKFKRYETVEVRNEDSDKWEIRSYMCTTAGAVTHLTLPEVYKNVRESGIRFEGWNQIQAFKEICETVFTPGSTVFVRNNIREYWKKRTFIKKTGSTHYPYIVLTKTLGQKTPDSFRYIKALEETEVSTDRVITLDGYEITIKKL